MLAGFVLARHHYFQRVSSSQQKASGFREFSRLCESSRFRRIFPDSRRCPSPVMQLRHEYFLLPADRESLKSKLMNKIGDLKSILILVIVFLCFLTIDVKL